MTVGLGVAGRAKIRLFAIILASAGGGFGARHFWPEPPPVVATAVFRPEVVDVPAPKSLLVTRWLVSPRDFVKKGQLVYEAYVSDNTRDEAIAVIRLRQTVEEMLRANRGTPTASIKQFEQKIRYSEQMMKRGGAIQAFRSPVDGYVMPGRSLAPSPIEKGAIVMRLARFDTLVAETELPVGVSSGRDIETTAWRPSATPSRRVTMHAGRTLELANPSAVLDTANLPIRNWEGLEVTVTGQVKNATFGALLAADVPREYRLRARVTAWSLHRTIVSNETAEAKLRRILVGRSIPNAQGNPRTISRIDRVEIAGLRRVTGQGPHVELRIVNPPRGLRQMAEAWWMAGVTMQADVLLPEASGS